MSHRLVGSIILCVAALSIGGALGWSARPSGRPDTSPSEGISQTAPALLEVHVAGFVAKPGVVAVLEGGIVADAVTAAGGLLATADPNAVNLAAPLMDGQQIVIPGKAPSGEPSSGGAGDGRLSLNQASSSELEGLPGVGPVLAGRIVEFRDSRGPFEVVEDLLEVPGVGEAKLDSMRDLVRP